MKIRAKAFKFIYKWISDLRDLKMNIIGLILLFGIGEQIVASSHNFISLVCKLTWLFYKYSLVDSLLFDISYHRD